MVLFEQELWITTGHLASVGDSGDYASPNVGIDWISDLGVILTGSQTQAQGRAESGLFSGLFSGLNSPDLTGVALVCDAST